MVTFTCQSCNSCLKKKAVEQHLYKCKNPILTCIDCVKDFDCSNYSGHVTCVTESERYGGQSFVPSSSMQKQNEWFTCISDVSNHPDLSPPNLKKILKLASEYPTCPRNKKKFVNFVLNNKAYAKFRGLAESAFDLISEEFNKRNAQSSENVDDKKMLQSNGNTDISSKRKKISETEVHEEAENNVTEKLSKKKNKKINGHVEQINGTEESHINEKKKKKKNKKNSESRENEVDNENDPENCENANVVNTESKKNKKKNKNRQNSIKDECLDEINGLNENEDTCGDDHQDVNGEENSIQTNGIDLSKLSKKERKKLLKQKKYEAEITSIENFKKEEQVELTEDTEKRKKKKQKHQNINDEEVNRMQKSSISEPDDKKIKLEDGEEEVVEVPEVIEKPKKFKWDEVIIQVLQTQDDGEMALKRLSKKICAEYANVYGERESYEEVLNKFNKKVVKTPGVRVHKDKAKLITSS